MFKINLVNSTPVTKLMPYTKQGCSHTMISTLQFDNLWTASSRGAMMQKQSLKRITIPTKFVAKISTLRKKRNGMTTINYKEYPTIAMEIKKQMFHYFTSWNCKTINQACGADTINPIPCSRKLNISKT